MVHSSVSHSPCEHLQPGVIFHGIDRDNLERECTEDTPKIFLNMVLKEPRPTNLVRGVLLPHPPSRITLTTLIVWQILCVPGDAKACAVILGTLSEYLEQQKPVRAPGISLLAPIGRRAHKTTHPPERAGGLWSCSTGKLPTPPHVRVRVRAPGLEPGTTEV